MTSRHSDRVFIGLAGALCLVAALAAQVFDLGGVAWRVREMVFDRLLLAVPRGEGQGEVVVVDIDRAGLAAEGAWPWPRRRLADLIDRIADAKPAVVAINILLPENAASAADEGRLAEALARAPAVMAVVLDPETVGAAVQGAPLAVNGPVEVPGLFIMPGATLPAPALLAAAGGVGVISLPAPEGQPVRKVFLLAGGAEAIFSGFAVETLRLKAGGPTLIASAPPQLLRIGERLVPLPEDGQLRVHFAGPARRAARTISAADLLTGKTPRDRLAGKIVLVGAGAPEAGGLRFTAADPFLPSVQIEADAIETILSGRIPGRPAWAEWLEWGAAAAMGLAALAAAMFLRASKAVALALSLPVAWLAGAGLAGLGFLTLIDPVMPAAAALFATAGAGAERYRRSSRRRAAIERRFALHLSPEVVRRISNNPDELKLAGETRIITALIADIEGFTETTERIGAERMVALLDRYVDTVAGLVIGHGGMVDKIVGDGIVAFFNAPLDLAGHAEKAVACARAIIAATDALRAEPDMALAALGRTRIGVETGPAILGDVGRGAKRNYTAMGRTVNLAARLEGANKEFGSSIAIGPGAAAALAGRMALTSLGRLTLRGIEGEVEIFAPA